MFEPIERVSEIVPSYSDRIIPRNPQAAAILKTRTPTNLYYARGSSEGTRLDNPDRTRLDVAACAWPADLSDDNVLARLPALNHDRAGKAG
jgi:hypothetical protein